MTDTGFHIAAFALDGKLEGISRLEPSDLSDEWRGAAGDLLQSGGPMFDYNWPTKLSHIRTKFASVQGTATATFLVFGEIAASVLLLRGSESPAQVQITALFVQSLANSDPVRELAAGSAPFEALQTIEERPLMAVMPWMSEGIEQRDHDLVRELAIHLAAAYFSLPWNESGDAAST
ncbi:MAG TPA: hypothetical protein VIT45_04460 [Allosphingosinicella sp.]